MKLPQISLKNKRSKLAVNIVITTVALSICVIIIASGVANGFRREIEKKSCELLDFAHINSTTSFLGNNVTLTNEEKIEIENRIKTTVEGVVESAVVMQNKYNVISSIAKGIETVKPGNIIISKTALAKLQLKIGEKVDVINIIDSTVKYESLIIANAFNSGIQDLEEGMVFLNIEDSRRFSNMEHGFSYYRIAEKSNTQGLNEWLERRGLQIQGVEQRAMELYGWLSMIDNNMWLVLMVMMVVSLVNLVISTLIIILDSTRELAVLRSLGMSIIGCMCVFVRGVGVYVIRGIAIGGMLGLSLCFMQYFWEILKLDSTAYFVDNVPIEVNFLELSIYIVTLCAVSVVSLMLPIRFMAKREIVQLLKYS